MGVEGVKVHMGHNRLDVLMGITETIEVQCGYKMGKGKDAEGSDLPNHTFRVYGITMTVPISRFDLEIAFWQFVIFFGRQEQGWKLVK